MIIRLENRTALCTENISEYQLQVSAVGAVRTGRHAVGAPFPEMECGTGRELGWSAPDATDSGGVRVKHANQVRKSSSIRFH